MLWFSNSKIGTKLALGFGTVLILSAFLGIIAIIQLSKMNGNVIDIGANWMARITYLSELRFDCSKLRRLELNYLTSMDDRTRAQTQTSIDRLMPEIEKDQKLYEATISSDDERQFYQGFRSAWDKHLAARDHIMELHREGKQKEANEYSASEGLSTFSAADKFLYDDVQFNVKGADAAMKSAASTYSSSRYWVIGLLVGAIGIGLLVSIGIARSLASAASGMLLTIQEVASNNLTVADLDVASHDEIGQACVALNKMKNNLHQVIQAIATNAQQVANASEQLSNTSQQITANSEETSAQAKVVSNAAQQVSQNLQTVATGAEEMGSTIKEIAKNASEAAKVASSAVRVAESTNAQWPSLENLRLKLARSSRSSLRSRSRPTCSRSMPLLKPRERVRPAKALRWSRMK